MSEVILVIDSNTTANIICNDNLNPDVVEIVQKGEKGDKGDPGENGTGVVESITNSEIETIVNS